MLDSAANTVYCTFCSRGIDIRMDWGAGSG